MKSPQLDTLQYHLLPPYRFRFQYAGDFIPSLTQNLGNIVFNRLFSAFSHKRCKPWPHPQLVQYFRLLRASSQDVVCIPLAWGHSHQCKSFYMGMWRSQQSCCSGNKCLQRPQVSWTWSYIFFRGSVISPSSYRFLLWIPCMPPQACHTRRQTVRHAFEKRPCTECSRSNESVEKLLMSLRSSLVFSKVDFCIWWSRLDSFMDPSLHP